MSIGSVSLSRVEKMWRIRTRLEIKNSLMELALLNLAIDNKLRSSDLVPLRVPTSRYSDKLLHLSELVDRLGEKGYEYTVSNFYTSIRVVILLRTRFSQFRHLLLMH